MDLRGAVMFEQELIIAEEKKSNLDNRKYLYYILKNLHLALDKEKLSDEFLESIMPWNAEALEKCQRDYI